MSFWSMFYIILEVITVFCIELFYPDNEVDIRRSFNHLRAKINVRDQINTDWALNVKDLTSHPNYG